MNRRDFLWAGAGAVAATSARADEPGRALARCALGMVAYSFAIRRAAQPNGPLHDPLGLVEHCQAIGAGGVQVGLGTRANDYCTRLRERLTAAGMFLEGIVSPPGDRSDLDRFERELRTACACGAQLVRVALLNGRRYETFGTAKEFRDFRERSRQSLTLARPVAERHKIRLAVENHKDRRAAELVELIRWVKSPHIGVCLDTGNNIALLEAPEETVDILAPHALTVHLKDMGVAEYADGFLLAEVPLGSGFLDLPRIIRTLQKANPRIRFNLEMLTRDPLRVPCLTPRYWGTLEDISGRRLAATLALVRSKASRQALPRVSELKPAQRLEREEDNVRRSLLYARARLELR
jgi:sugar phosphate isomerase/epimerase